MHGLGKGHHLPGGKRGRIEIGHNGLLDPLVAGEQRMHGPVRADLEKGGHVDARDGDQARKQLAAGNPLVLGRGHGFHEFVGPGRQIGKALLYAGGQGVARGGKAFVTGRVGVAPFGIGLDQGVTHSGAEHLGKLWRQPDMAGRVESTPSGSQVVPRLQMWPRSSS